jgi:hypothetical protein
MNIELRYAYIIPRGVPDDTLAEGLPVIMVDYHWEMRCVLCHKTPQNT